MKIIKLTATRISFKEVFISWAVLGLRKDTRFTIERSFNVCDFETIGDAIGLTSFIDINTNIKNYDTIRYRVSCDGDESIVNLRGESDNYLLCMAEDNRWRLDNLPSLEAIAFCIVKSDSYCPDCWSEEMQKKTRTNCTSCDGSGYTNAYKGPIKIKLSLNNVFPTRELIGNTERDTEYLNCWTANYPDLDMGDYIFLNGKKYVLFSKPSNQEHQGLNGKPFMTMQTLQLKMLEQTYLSVLDKFLEF